jgi:hypothetical protein
MASKHREFKKHFQTELHVNDEKLPLNHFMQETLANMIVGLLQTLKDVDEPENTVEINVMRLAKTRVVDAHTYP